MSGRQCCPCSHHESFDFSNTPKPKVNHEIFMLKTDMVQEATMGFYIKELRERESRIRRLEKLLKKCKEENERLQYNLEGIEEEKFKALRNHEISEKANLQRILDLQNSLKEVKEKARKTRNVSAEQRLLQPVLTTLSFDKVVQTLSSSELRANSSIKEVVSVFTKLEGNLIKLSNHCYGLEEQVKEGNSLKLQLTEMKRRLESAMNNLQTNSEENKTLRNSINEQEKIISELNSRIGELEESQRNYDFGKEFYGKLQSEFNAVKEDYEKLCGEYEFIKAENEKLSNELQRFEISENFEENVEVEPRVHTFNSHDSREEENVEHPELAHMRNTFGELASSLEEEAAKLREQLEIVENELEKSQGSCEKAWREIEEFREQNASLQQAYNDLAAENTRLSHKLLLAYGDIESKGSAIDTLEKEIEIALKDKENLKISLSMTKERLDHELAKKSGNEAEKNEEVARLRSDAALMKTREETKEKEISKLRNELQILINQQEPLVNQLSNLRNENARIPDFERELENYEKRQIELQSKIQELEGQHNSIINKLPLFRQEKEEMKTSLDRAMNEIDRLKDLINSKAEIENQLTQLQIENSNLKDALLNSQTQSNALESSLHDNIARIKELESQVIELITKPSNSPFQELLTQTSNYIKKLLTNADSSYFSDDSSKDRNNEIQENLKIIAALLRNRKKLANSLQSIEEGDESFIPATERVVNILNSHF